MPQEAAVQTGCTNRSTTRIESITERGMDFRGVLPTGCHSGSMTYNVKETMTQSDHIYTTPSSRRDSPTRPLPSAWCSAPQTVRNYISEANCRSPTVFRRFSMRGNPASEESLSTNNTEPQSANCVSLPMCVAAPPRIPGCTTPCTRDASRAQRRSRAPATRGRRGR